MHVVVMMKQAGKKRALGELGMSLPDREWTLRQLVERIVREKVATYNAKQTDEALVRWLTDQEISDQAETGKVGFFRRFNERDVDPERAVAAALQAHADGLYRVFVDGSEVVEFADVAPLHEGSRIAFIRFTFLAGRMW